MASIAYITDSKLLEMHRLNQNKEMNFWRASNNINFTNFKIGDLVFFLSKDKEHMYKKEKGIVGYGRCDKFELCSINTMWRKYAKLNGYNTKEKFIESITKVTKDHKTPTKISSIYLKDVVFFGAPIYLSECGMKISNRVESYIYLDNDKHNVVFNILDKAKAITDLWSNRNDASNIIEKEQIRNSLYIAYDKIGLKNDKYKNKSFNELKKYISDDITYIKESKLEAYKIIKNQITIYFAPLYLNDKTEEIRLLIGQANMYKKLINSYYSYDIIISFVFINNEEISNYIDD